MVLKSRLCIGLLCAPMLASAAFAAENAGNALPCKPSPECAIQMARQDPQNFQAITEGRILVAIARRGTRQELDAALAQARGSNYAGSPHPESWRSPSANALSIAGRTDEAISIAMGLPPGTWRRAVLVEMALASVAANRIGDAASVMRQLTPADGDGRSGGFLELLGRLHAKGYDKQVREVARQLGFDITDVNGPAASYIADADLALGIDEFALRRAAALPAEDATLQLIEIAHAQSGQQQQNAARATPRPRPGARQGDQGFRGTTRLSRRYRERTHRGRRGCRCATADQICPG
jgi:hypothetical protein